MEYRFLRDLEKELVEDLSVLDTEELKLRRGYEDKLENTRLKLFGRLLELI